MKEFNEKRYLYIDLLADVLDSGDLAEYSDVSDLLSSDKWKACIAPFFGQEELVEVEVSNDGLYNLACFIDMNFTTHCHYRLNEKILSREDRVLNLMGWIVKYFCNTYFEIDDWSEREGE